MNSHSWVENAILEAANPNLYADNAFRVLKLPVTASPREIKRQVEKIEIRRKLLKPKIGPGTLRPLIPESAGRSRHGSPSENDKSLDKYSVRRAAQRLAEPQSHLADEVFWFWPLDTSWDGTDPALESVLVGNYQGAANLWKQAEAAGIRAAIANHNLAVFHHLAALNYIQASEHLHLSNQTRQDLEYQWREAHRRWEQLISQDDFWKELGARIRELEDPRLTPTAAEEVRRALPTALLLIGARLLIAAAENGQSDQIPRYSSLVHGSPFAPEHRETALKIAVAPIRERISVACNSAEERTNSDPVHANETVRSLLNGGGVSTELAIVDALLPKRNATRVGIHDQAAIKLLSCVVEFGNRTEDYESELELLTEIRKLAEGESAITKIDLQIDSTKENASIDLRWYGPGYHDAAPELFNELEKARGQFDLMNWNAAIEILRGCLRSWKGERERSLINKPLAFSLYMRAGTSFSQAIQSNFPAWGKPTSRQVEAVRSAIRAAAKDLVEALELDPGNNKITEIYDKIRSFASEARVSIPSKPRAPRGTTRTASGIGSGNLPPAPPGHMQPTASSGGFGARGMWIAIGVLVVIVLAAVMSSNQAPGTTPSRSGSSSGSSSSAAVANTPVPTRTRVPTRVPTRTPSEPDCFAWDEVGARQKDRFTCVYGQIVRIYDAQPYVQIIRFGSAPGTFLLRGERSGVPDIFVGDCVRVEGTIIQSAGYLYMNIDHMSTQLTMAQSWVCNS